ncbi:MAG: hypothetical protein NUW01_04450 [Gemmatimonadaceae bacterium]|nr:hypothetical protein [Gemmatimonadaceae bacterium]
MTEPTISLRDVKKRKPKVVFPHDRPQRVYLTVPERDALVEAVEEAAQARNALAGLIVMLGTGRGDAMGTARKHFHALDDKLARFSDVGTEADVSRWQLVWWWCPSEWAWGDEGTWHSLRPDGRAYRSWQFGPLEIRRWEATS